LRGAAVASTTMCAGKPALVAGTGLTQKVENYARIVTAAFACDTTRVASIQVGTLRPGEFGSSVESAHRDVAHHGTDTGKILGMSDYYRVHAGHFATLLKHLRSWKEPDGSTLLDNTIALWVPECGSWTHQAAHVPVVIGGGAGFKMGRYLYWGADPIVNAADPTAFAGYKRLGPPNTKLLVSIARQMGLTEINQIGDAATANGKDLRGPLPGLLGPIKA
jgi:hypothetical protein